MDGVSVFQPQYYEHFKCQGGNCKNSCCHDWSIYFVEEDLYERYKKIKDAEYRKKVLEEVVILQESPFKAEYKSVKSSRCFFLQEDGLCYMQKNYGEGYMSSTCKSYPRVVNLIGVEMECYLTLSCEEAARLVLLQTDNIKFEQKSHGQLPEVINSRLETRVYTTSKNALDIFWNIRTASIFILQSRKYRFWIRMVVLGFFIRQAETLLSENKEKEIKELSDEFINRMQSNVYDHLESQIKGHEDMQVETLYKMVSCIVDNVEDKSIAKYVSQMSEGLGIKEVSADDKRVELDKFIQARETWYKPFFDNRQTIMENYIINIMLMRMFPFHPGGKKGVYGNYLELAVKYSLLQAILVGMAAYHKENFNEEHVIEVVAAISRQFEHSRLVKHLIDILEDNKKSGLGIVSILMKE